MKFPY